MDTCCSAGGGSVSRLHLQYFSRRWTACVPTELAPNSTHRLLTSADICILTLWYCIISLLSATHVVAYTDVTVFAFNSFTLFCDSVTWWWNWRADIVEAMPFQSERWWQNVASALTLLVAWEEGQACEKPAPLSSTSTQALTTETSVWMWRKKMRWSADPGSPMKRHSTGQLWKVLACTATVPATDEADGLSPGCPQYWAVIMKGI